MNTYYRKTTCLVVLSQGERTWVIIVTMVLHSSEKLHQLYWVGLLNPPGVHLSWLTITPLWSEWLKNTIRVALGPARVSGWVLGGWSLITSSSWSGLRGNPFISDTMLVGKLIAVRQVDMHWNYLIKHISMWAMCVILFFLLILDSGPCITNLFRTVRSEITILQFYFLKPGEVHKYFLTILIHCTKQCDSWLVS